MTWGGESSDRFLNKAPSFSFFFTKFHKNLLHASFFSARNSKFFSRHQKCDEWRRTKCKINPNKIKKNCMLNKIGTEAACRSL